VIFTGGVGKWVSEQPNALRPTAGKGGCLLPIYGNLERELYLTGQLGLGRCGPVASGIPWITSLKVLLSLFSFLSCKFLEMLTAQRSTRRHSSTDEIFDLDWSVNLAGAFLLLGLYVALDSQLERGLEISQSRVQCSCFNHWRDKFQGYKVLKILNSTIINNKYASTINLILKTIDFNRTNYFYVKKSKLNDYSKNIFSSIKLSFLNKKKCNHFRIFYMVKSNFFLELALTTHHSHPWPRQSKRQSKPEPPRRDRR
jgi:hypothetical protein